MKAAITLIVELDETWLEFEGRRKGRENPVERLVSLLEGRAFDSVRHVDGVMSLAVTNSIDPGGRQR